MHAFDYGFLSTDISAELAGVSNALFDLRGRNALHMESDLAGYGKLREAAIVECVRDSNAIEGIVTTSDRLIGIVEGTVSP